MASSLTSPGLKAVSDKCLIALRPYLTRLGGFTLDLSSDFIGREKFVAVPIVAGASESFNAASANYAHTTGSLKYVDVSVANHVKATFSLTDTDCLEVDDAPMWTNFARAGADVIGADIVKGVMGKFTDAGAAKTLTLADGVTVSAVAGLAASVMAEGVDPSQCTLLLTPAAFFSLVGALPASVYGNADVIKAGRIDGALLGFGEIAVAPDVTTAGVGFVVPRGALAVATRIPKPPKGGAGYVEIGSQTDEISGFTLGVRVHVSPDVGETFLNIEAAYGAALTADKGGPAFFKVATAG